MHQSPSFKKMDSLENADVANSQSYGLTRLNSADQTQSNGSLDYKKESKVVKQLKSNIEKLERLERRLMKGKHKKHSSRITSLDSQDNYQLMDTNKYLMEQSGKSKKGKKNWRFAYDLYCKEIISSNH